MIVDSQYLAARGKFGFIGLAVGVDVVDFDGAFLAKFEGEAVLVVGLAGGEYVGFD